MSDNTILRVSNKTALVFGASGLIGAQVVNQLLNHPAYEKVIAFYRKEVDLQHLKLETHIVDLEEILDWMQWIRGHDLFICLGTTMEKAGSKKAFHHIEYDYITKIAGIAQSNGVNQLMLVSALSADAKSLFFYNQVKGLIEDYIKQLEFWAIHILRPSLLLGERNEQRTLESISAGVGLALKAIGPKLFSKITPIEGEKVARCMIKVAQETRSGVFYYPSEVIAKIGKPM